jgi:hypothetical protein
MVGIGMTEHQEINVAIPGNEGLYAPGRGGAKVFVITSVIDHVVVVWDTNDTTQACADIHDPNEEAVGLRLKRAARCQNQKEIEAKSSTDFTYSTYSISQHNI